VEKSGAKNASAWRRAGETQARRTDIATAAAAPSVELVRKAGRVFLPSGVDVTAYVEPFLAANGGGGDAALIAALSGDPDADAYLRPPTQPATLHRVRTSGARPAAPPGFASHPSRAQPADKAQRCARADRTAAPPAPLVRRSASATAAHAPSGGRSNATPAIHSVVVSSAPSHGVGVGAGAALPTGAHGCADGGGSGAGGCLGRWVVTSSFPSPRLLLTTTTETARAPRSRSARKDANRAERSLKEPGAASSDAARGRAHADGSGRAAGGWGAEVWDGVGATVDRLSLMGSLEAFGGLPTDRRSSGEGVSAQLKARLASVAQQAFTQALGTVPPEIQQPSLRVRFPCRPCRGPLSL
jgi:hypothetical protein